MARQTRLDEFLLCVRFEYVPGAVGGSDGIAPGTDRRGLSEKLLRRRLEKQGWIVWRCDLLTMLRREDAREEPIFPVVRNKYALLEHLLDQHLPGTREHLQYLLDVHHGLPDLLCFRRGSFKFVECKLGNEQLLLGQKRCITLLLRLGLKIEVHVLVGYPTKIRAAIINLCTGEKRILERQLRLTKRLMART